MAERVQQAREAQAQAQALATREPVVIEHVPTPDVQAGCEASRSEPRSPMSRKPLSRKRRSGYAWTGPTYNTFFQDNVLSIGECRSKAAWSCSCCPAPCGAGVNTLWPEVEVGPEGLEDRFVTVSVRLTRKVDASNTAAGS